MNANKKKKIWCDRRGAFTVRHFLQRRGKWQSHKCKINWKSFCNTKFKDGCPLHRSHFRWFVSCRICSWLCALCSCFWRHFEQQNVRLHTKHLTFQTKMRNEQNYNSDWTMTRRNEYDFDLNGNEGEKLHRLVESAFLYISWMQTEKNIISNAVISIRFSCFYFTFNTAPAKGIYRLMIIRDNRRRDGTKMPNCDFSFFFFFLAPLCFSDSIASCAFVAYIRILKCAILRFIQFLLLFHCTTQFFQQYWVWP